MLKFFFKPRNQIIIFLVLVGCVGFYFLMGVLWDEEVKEQMTDFSENEKEYKPVTFDRDNVPFKAAPKRVKVTEKSSKHTQKPFRSSQKQEAAKAPKLEVQETAETSGPKRFTQKYYSQKEKKEKKKKLIAPLDLFTGSGEKEEARKLSENYAPYGRLIPCETVIALDSSKMNTPVIALVTEDVYHEGRFIIPAGAEVHGKASPDRTRERVEASGSWVIVWRDRTAMNGVELKLTGMALDRSIDFNTGKWGTDDGSAGLRGKLIKSDSWEEIRIFASKFISAYSSGMQKKKPEVNPFGGAVLVPEASHRSAALEGSRAVLDRYADKIMQEIDDHGFYVHVPSGTQFYLYVTQTIDLEAGLQGNKETSAMWNQDAG